MRAAVLTGPGEIAIRERPDPIAGPGQVLIRVAAVGVCGSDVAVFRGGGFRGTSAAGLVLGHEAAGVVTAVGADVTRVTPGTRVSIEPGTGCGMCRVCLTGRYNLCDDMRYLGTPALGRTGSVDGALCEYVAVPERCAHPIPDHVTLEAAALLEPLAVALSACARGEVGPGSRVIVLGAGSLGLIVAEAARAHGAAEVILTGRSAARLDVARSARVTTVHTPHQPIPHDADVVIDCTGHTETIVTGLAGLRRGGHLVLVGVGGGSIPLSLLDMHIQDWTISGVFRHAHQWPRALALVTPGQIDLDWIITGRYPLAEAARALTERDCNRGAIKTIVTPWMD